MTPNSNDSEQDVISPADMRTTLDKEIHDVMRAANLRIREFSKLTQAYTAGELSPAEATAAYITHMDKWGDVFPTISRATSKMSDEEIMAELDRTTQLHSSRVQAGKQSQQSHHK